MSVQARRSGINTIINISPDLTEFSSSQSRATSFPPEVVERVMEKLDERIVGQEELKIAIETALLTGGSIHISGDVGLGKTSAIRSTVQYLNEVLEEYGIPVRVNYVRISGTPDLMPEDLRGDWTVNEEGKVVFQPGRLYEARKRKTEDGKEVVTIVHFDEIDKIPERTLRALVDAMGEQLFVTRTGEVVPLNMIVMATSNVGSLREGGLEKLDRVISDRFLLSNVKVRRLEYEELLEVVRINLGIPIDDPISRVACGIVYLSYSDEVFQELIDEPLSPRAAISLVEAVKSQLRNLYMNGQRKIDLAAQFRVVGLPLLRDRFTPSIKGEKEGKERIIEMLIEEAFRRFFR